MMTDQKCVHCPPEATGGPTFEECIEVVRNRRDAYEAIEQHAQARAIEAVDVALRAMASRKGWRRSELANANEKATNAIADAIYSLAREVRDLRYELSDRLSELRNAR